MQRVCTKQTISMSFHFCLQSCISFPDRHAIVSYNTTTPTKLWNCGADFFYLCVYPLFNLLLSSLSARIRPSVSKCTFVHTLFLHSSPFPHVLMEHRWLLPITDFIHKHLTRKQIIFTSICLFFITYNFFIFAHGCCWTLPCQLFKCLTTKYAW